MINKKRAVALLVVAVILIFIAMCSTDFMLRVAVFMHSPKSAVTMSYEKSDQKNEGEEFYTITKNAPIEKETQGTLTTWSVHHFGPLKFVRYYGEG